MSIYDQLYCNDVSGLTGRRTKPYIEGWQFHYELDTAAAEDPVTVDEAKAFARIDPTGDATEDANNDALVDELIKAATHVFEGQTGRALVNQTWIAWLDCLPCSSVLQLCKGRIDSVTSIKSYNDDGSAETLDSGAYVIDSDNGRVGLIGSEVWPTGDRGFKTFAVEYVAGYGAASAVPEEAKTAIKKMVSHWFEHRETATDLTFSTVPYDTKLLINRLTIGRI